MEANLLRLLPSAPAQVDLFALSLILIQATLLYKIARKAEALRGPRLVAAARSVRADQVAQREVAVQRRERKMSLGSLDERQRGMLERARAVYTKEGDALDDLWEPFLLRFFVSAEWNEAEALRRMLATAEWRRKVGAAAVRQKFASGGFKVGAHPAMARMLNAMGIAMCHRRTKDGDLLQLGHVGAFDPDLWLRTMTDDEFTDLGLHFCEYLGYTADALSAAEKRLVRQAFVLDYDGMGWRHLNMSIFLRLQPQIAIMATYYPEMIGSATCVNAPSLFSFLWGIVSPGLSDNMRQRVQTVTEDETHAALARLAPADALPRTLGGECDELPADVRDALGLDAAAARLRGFYDREAWRRG